jgi:molybdate transport system substrate-binding protein
MKKTAALLLLALLTACGGSSRSGSSTPRYTLTVLAASSLTESFTTLAHRFEQQHPGTRVHLSFGGSPTLAQQILAGAPADVFAAASAAAMTTVTGAGEAVGTPVTFARNSLEIAVPPGHSTITSLADTTRDGVKLALCAPTVPCGTAAAKVYAAAGLTPHPVTQEQDVKLVLSKVELGEVDAGLVYVTDVKAAGNRVTGIAFAEAAAALTAYPAVALRISRQPVLAGELLALLTSAEGQEVLRGDGFLPPG